MGTVQTRVATASGPVWVRRGLLVGPALALVLGAAAAFALDRYRYTHVVWYPGLALVNYTPERLAHALLQPLGLVLLALSLVCAWAALRWRYTALLGSAAVAFVVAMVLLATNLSPLGPVATATHGTTVYQLASIPTEKGGAPGPELYPLFACDAQGLVCQQVTTFVAFDQSSGAFVTGTPTLIVDAQSGVVSAVVGAHVIGTYTPGAGS